METVFTNLIDNAVKYSVENGKISINIEYNEQKSELVYQVSNFSENILGQNLETLFSLGARGKNAAENIRGLGIGLHLVRRICRLYNGSCSAFCIPLENPLENKLENLGGNLPKNKNSTELCKVVFEARLTLLPYSPETSELLKNDRANGYNKILSEKKSLKNDAQESELKNLMQNNLILIVEDNIALLKNIAELLKPYCSVITATNGKDAICKIKKNAPDLIISDMVMPVMGGKAFFDFCRGDENLKNVPFLFLTGVQDVSLKNSFIKQGVVDYIFKPFSQEELLLKIYSILSLCMNVRKDFARTITDFVNNSTAGGMHRGISFMEK
ncbi:MAG: hybrid sensor histidine kinase/response regulator [Treponema sp.]|nr:hybrid sensor histidine kinase/response regulator [Treponema sp.]